MMSFIHASGYETRHARERAERRQYRILYALAFPIGLGAALVSRAIGRRPLGAPKSILGHAKALAGATIPMLFMG
jgi:hypothetical protein